jgi:hypothetical protein
MHRGMTTHEEQCNSLRLRFVCFSVLSQKILRFSGLCYKIAELPCVSLFTDALSKVLLKSQSFSTL